MNYRDNATPLDIVSGSFGVEVITLDSDGKGQGGDSPCREVIVWPEKGKSIRAGSISDDSLVCWLRMDDIDGSGNPIDLGSANNTWTKNNQAVQIDDGIIGKAFTFDGTSDWLEASTPSGLPLLSASRSVTCWLRDSGSGGATNTLVNYGTAVTSQMFAMATDSTGHLKLAVGGGNKTGASSVLHDGEWHFVCITLNSVDGNQVSDTKFYVDGQPDAQNTLADQTIATENSFISVGSFPADANAFNGDIDDVRIYSRELSEAEILILYNLRTLQPIISTSAIGVVLEGYNRMPISNSNLLFFGGVSGDDVYLLWRS